MIRVAWGPSDSDIWFRIEGRGCSLSIVFWGRNTLHIRSNLGYSVNMLSTSWYLECFIKIVTSHLVLYSSVRCVAWFVEPNNYCQSSKQKFNSVYEYAEHKLILHLVHTWSLRFWLNVLVHFFKSVCRMVRKLWKPPPPTFLMLELGAGKPLN